MQSVFKPQLPAKTGEKLHWRKLHGCSPSLAVAQAAKENGPILYICSQAQHIRHVHNELSFFLGDTLPIYRFPDWECLPYDRFSPHPDIISQRLLTLHNLPDLQQGIIILPVSSLIQWLAPVQYVQANAFNLKCGDTLETDSFRKRLIDAGYYSVEQVMSPGEFAIRGGIVDVFPSGMNHPFRLDLFDTEIESIKLFDPETQRSNESLSEIRLLPAREFPLDEQSIKKFRQSFRSHFAGDPQKSLIYRDISKGITPAGAEFYLPLFFDKTATLFDYLPENTQIIIEDGVKEACETLFEESQQRFENAKLDPEWPPLEPNELFLPVQDIFSGLKAHSSVQILSLNLQDKKHVVEYNSAAPVDFKINPHAENPYQPFFTYIENNEQRILLLAESAGRRETLLGLLKNQKIEADYVTSWQQFIESNKKLVISTAEIERGLKLETDGIEIITESQLYGERVFQRRRRSDKNRDPDSIIRSLAELNIGDAIVHEDHGVGRYAGLQTLSIDNLDNEFLTLEYKDGDKLYLPILSLNLISRYIGGNPETAPLHKLGSDAWIKIRKKAKEKAYDVAAELLEIQAMRLARTGHSFPEPDYNYDAFAAGFSFEETPDQQQVINDVLKDMVSAKPMDRLVCGDVGFGKTEIALRAAYMAIAGQKQVVILVPTTLLAQQHFKNFSDRFADWPVNVELLSRFRSAKETAATLEGIKTGTVDIVIGTHRLLQKDIDFKRLGLMIIDEEHRFGVRQKERLKQLRNQVDILTLTATPIPRTLNFALSGLRDISVIATPPRERLSVKTFVREWNDGLVYEACMREIRRGGQVYFLHNEVQTIEKIQTQLQELIPEARIEHAHGQMRERELESIMRDFYHQRFNILLSTTIIESGIDVPSANTIIINRADRFGLAQLHQLRGRVGRSHHQAYAYMIAPPQKQLSADAQKRLSAIESLDTLGAGFALASQDLEIRGAGELLGESQSGSIDEIGYSLYSTFLEQAIANLNKQKGKTDNTTNVEHKNVDVNLHIPARFPDDYIPDVHLRLTMYKRISSALNKEQLYDLEVETVDRFGLLPDAAKNLFAVAELKLTISQLDIKSIEVGPKGGKVVFDKNPDINMEALLLAIANDPQQFSLKDPQTIQIKREMLGAEERFVMVKELIQLLSHG